MGEERQDVMRGGAEGSLRKGSHGMMKSHNRLAGGVQRSGGRRAGEQGRMW